jgi:hypothetical protein
MRILGLIHTYNYEDVIERSLEALLNQTHPVDEVLIEDNASTDGTLRRSFPEKVSVLRHDVNLGTSGSVRAGLIYALDRRYDWLWIFDRTTTKARVSHYGLPEGHLGWPQATSPVPLLKRHGGHAAVGVVPHASSRTYSYVQ